MQVPETDRDLGHSEAQMRDLLRDEFERFQKYMYFKTSARDQDGLIYYDVDVRMYIAIRERRSS